MSYGRIFIKSETIGHFNDYWVSFCSFRGCSEMGFGQSGKIRGNDGFLFLAVLIEV
jgi:hypothetical protein